MMHNSITWLEISSSAIHHNIRQFKAIFSPRTELMAVIKSNAYGHGMVGVARIAQSAGVKWFGTVNLDEAIELRQAGIKSRILVLSFFNPDKLDVAIKKNITLTIYSLSAANEINRLAKKYHKIVPVHLKIDTGTTRLGLLPANAILAVKAMTKLPNLWLEGIFTHLADAENPNQQSANRQVQVFNQVLDHLSEQGIRIPIRHLACSAATILNKHSHFSLARVGISLYGLWSIENNGTHQANLKLKPALSWHTRVLQVKTVPGGTRIGYGSTYRTKRSATIAVLPVGYWDGFDRKLSNNGEVLIRGHRCPIRGRVCMNLTMVDVSKVPAIRPDDKATLIGTDGRQTITADELAKRVGTINYEIVTRINPLIPRFYI
jgi:alanine racemase